jgi:selenide, water dikinase
LAQVLRPLSDIFPQNDYPQLLVGLSEPDDSAVYQIDGDRAIISTTDFFPPVVDTPYEFGAIAAANALSDVYAMGGRPLMAINLVAFPDGLDMQILTEILRGGADKVKEAGAVIAGGHTVTDKEPKYGLCVTGEVPVDKIIKKSGAQVGDVLILTKPLGVGVITTALKRGLADSSHVESAIQSMSHLNRRASELAQQYGVHAMTDITGYSLLGHGHEMAYLSHTQLVIEFDKLQWLDGALRYGRQDIFPGGMERNREYFGKWITFSDDIEEFEHGLLFDPQTSGGLLMAVDSTVADNLLQDLLRHNEKATIVGHVEDGNGELFVKRC